MLSRISFSLSGVAKGLTGERTALIGVEVHRRSLPKSPAEGDDAEPCVQGVGKLSREDEAAVPIDAGREVHETAAHREVGDIGAPDLIRSDDDGVPEQVGINLLFGVKLARSRFGANPFEPHKPMSRPIRLWFTSCPCRRSQAVIRRLPQEGAQVYRPSMSSMISRFSAVSVAEVFT